MSLCPSNRSAFIVTAIVLAAFAMMAWSAGSENSIECAFKLRVGLTPVIGFDADSNSTYRIVLAESSAGRGSILKFRIARHDGQIFELRGFTIRVRVPAAPVKGLWYPSTESLSTTVMTGEGSAPLRGIADANEGIPYIGASAEDGQNILAMGLANQALAVEIGADPVDADAVELRLHARTSRTAAFFEESFYISNDVSMDWFDAAADYATWVDETNGYRPMPISARAYEPVYDVWYQRGDNVDEKIYLSAAQSAQEVGLGSFIADSGWDVPTGEYARWLNGRTGDYDPPRDRFHNLRETFDQIRSIYGLNVQLWLQPFAVGRESQRYEATRDMHIQVPTNQIIPGWPGFPGEPFSLPLTENTLENVNLCPRLTATRVYLQQLIDEVAIKYSPDSYWLDFIDGMPSFCVAPHSHDIESFGEGLSLTLGTIRSAIQAATPGAAVQFRANYANLHNKEFTNVWQAEDSPGDFDRMRLKTLRMRPFSHGVVFASDQLYWKPDLDDTKVSQFVMTAVMIGVPAFGSDLAQLTESQREIIRSWMRFYRNFQNDLINGSFHPFGRLPVPNHKIESPDRAFVYLRNLDFSTVEIQAGAIYLLNATDSESISADIRVPACDCTYSVLTTNRFLEAGSAPISIVPNQDGVLHIEAVVERGGMAMLVRSAPRL